MFASLTYEETRKQVQFPGYGVMDIETAPGDYICCRFWPCVALSLCNNLTFLSFTEGGGSFCQPFFTDLSGAVALELPGLQHLVGRGRSWEHVPVDTHFLKNRRTGGGISQWCLFAQGARGQSCLGTAPAGATLAVVPGAVSGPGSLVEGAARPLLAAQMAVGRRAWRGCAGSPSSPSLCPSPQETRSPWCPWRGSWDRSMLRGSLSSQGWLRAPARS